jgi:hypothetical protein
VLWCNFDLARRLGFAVPSSNRMTPQFHAQLIAALCYRAVVPGEDVGHRQTITIHADRYGGAGVAPALGSARSGFLPYGNLLLKGIGFTPLFKHDNADDFAHSTGLMPLSEGLFEAIFGEVNANLFSRGTTRILALIDQRKHLVYPNGRRLCAIAVRAGMQLRPGHLLAQRVRRKNFRFELFCNITRATGQLITRTGGPRATPDVQATMRRVLDDHARTATELYRWRMLHGAISSSNMEMSGAMLDLATQTSQPRTAPIHIIDFDFDNSTFGREHLERAAQLAPMYRALLRSMPAAQRQLFNARPLDHAAEIRRRYTQHLRVLLLCAVGLKPEVAEQLNATEPALSARLTETLTKMASLRNPGGMKASRSRPLSESASVLDVYHLLRVLPRRYFAAPAADHRRSIRAALKPVYKGNQAQTAKRRAVVAALIAEFAADYAALLRRAETYAAEFYDGRANLRASVCARAHFENRPLTELYYPKLFKEFHATVAAYDATGDAHAFAAAIDRRITASLRNVEALLTQGRVRRRIDGSFEIEQRTIAGVEYAVRAWNAGGQKRRVCVRVQLERAGAYYVVPALALSGLTKRQVQAMRCRYSVAGQKVAGAVGARLERRARRRLALSFEFDCAPYLVGELKVAFYDSSAAAKRGRRNTINFRGYTFAVPDRHELLKLIRRSSARVGCISTARGSACGSDDHHARRIRLMAALAGQGG